MSIRVSIGMVFLALVSVDAFAERAQHLKGIAKVTVAKTSHVDKKTVLLEDVAQFENCPREVANYLKKTVITHRDQIKSEVRIPSFAIGEIVRGPLAVAQEKFKKRIMLSLPQELIILGPRAAFNEKTVSERIVSHMKSGCESCQFQVTDLKLPLLSNQKFLNSVWRIRFGSNPVKGVFSLPVVFDQEGRSTYWISGRLIKKQMVPVATQQLEAHRRIKKGDFKMVFRDVTYAIDGLPNHEKLVGQKLRRGILSDHVIWQGSLDRKKAIRYGDTTEVILGDETWSIKTSAIAQQNADVGDRIRLLNPQTRKFMTGVVVGERKVRIQ